ncbi:MAG: class I SAM-dependent methyltransferase [Cyanobacteriota bacterium]
MVKQICELPTGHGYNLWAPFYDNNDNPMIGLDNIIVESELNINFNNLSIIDLGCGTGRHSIEFANKGANVIALDFAEEMIKIAKINNTDKINFIFHDLSKIWPVKNDQFDLVFSSLVLEHIYNLDLFFSECKRVCKPRGLIYITAMHPAMILKGTQANFDDPVSGFKIRPKGYPNKISDYINAISKSKLNILTMNEHSGTEWLVEKYPRSIKYLGWPMLLSFTLSIN